MNMDILNFNVSRSFTFLYTWNNIQGLNGGFVVGSSHRWGGGAFLQFLLKKVLIFDIYLKRVSIRSYFCADFNFVFLSCE